MGKILKSKLTGCPGRDRMAVGFTTTYAISAHHVVRSNPTQVGCTQYNII